ncbi:MAG: hypothetical protein GX174_09915 [Lentisphaerae bacterium]|nr:hypothetical protein [Lentisphaerota bacterium]
MPGWRDIALPKAEALACDEWAARPEGTWGIYQTAVGKRFHIVHCESRDEKLTTTLLLVR